VLCLPAIAAIASVTAAIAAASAATTVTTASAASTTAATPAAVSAAPAAAAAALCLRPCFVYHQVAPAEILPVQGIHRAIRILVTIHFHEGEAARLSCKTVTDEIDA
jgi:hypothetical protein